MARFYRTALGSFNTDLDALVFCMANDSGQTFRIQRGCPPAAEAVCPMKPFAFEAEQARGIDHFAKVLANDVGFVGVLDSAFA